MLAQGLWISMSSPFSGEQSLRKLGDATAQVAGLRAVVVGHLAVGGGAVVGAGAAHALPPGRAEDRGVALLGLRDAGVVQPAMVEGDAGRRPHALGDGFGELLGEAAAGVE